MKGKTFKARPSSPKNEIVAYFLQKRKPWIKDETKTYTWKSSIPPKWIDLKGEEFFKHVSEVKEPILSIEILQNSKKYIHDLKINSQKTIVRPATVKNTENSAPPVEKSEKLNHRRFSLTVKSQNERNLLVAGSSTPLIINFDSRPVTKEGRCASAGYEEYSKIEDFLKRFDRKPAIKEQPPANKGLFGWKLRSVRDKSHERRSSYCKIFNVKKNSEKIFHSVCQRRMHSIQL
jgi:hypothetical protein